MLESLQFNMNDVVSEYDFCQAENIGPDNQELVLPNLEITTRIGCNVNCRFCPQSLLMDVYFKENKDRDKLMSLETFSKCLEKLPINYRVVFSGFSEPLLNPDCIEMIKLACQSGRQVDLYTTLVGATGDVIDQICDIPFRSVILHVADQYGYARIPVSDQYYKNVEKLINTRKKDGARLIDKCSSQAEPDPRIAEICSGKYDILTICHDRAGNLTGSGLFKAEYLTGPIRCVMGSKPRRSVLLPDGTLVLCCMDFGTKHVLGNLLENSYDEIMNGQEMQKVEQEMEESRNGESVLCRRCSIAYPIAK